MLYTSVVVSIRITCFSGTLECVSSYSNVKVEPGVSLSLLAVFITRLASLVQDRRETIAV